ncbi:uncharacterized protein LOC126799950 [Argentina anserina]|uniref:uncharacterized protein LOC126799950 n=1 Tax=Argentina anserina TaxID=57926 RepID=UPI002176462C|nr:uncharacterized protein LOC126799950 [Potentilla anserina]
MNGGLGKLGTVLTLVIAVSLLVGLVGQIFYILCRRKKLHNRSFPHRTESVLPGDSASSQSRGFFSFFLCWKNQSRIEPQEARHDVPPSNYHNELQELEDIIKWQALYGSSRLLFTIEEGEREGLDSETTYSSCAEKEVVVKTKTTTKVYLEECHGVPDVAVTVVNIEMDELFTTPLETPCASPPYYTPSASPTRESV